MSCSNLTFKQRMTPDKRKKLIGIYDSYPCRWCMSCRIDRRNYFEDRLNYAHLLHKSASFVTFTYDDYRIPLNRDGEPTLLKSDWIKFRDNLKRQLRYHGYPKLCYPDYQYFTVGEYGDQFGRPHYHVLFFGLDFYYAKPLFKNLWHNGLIDVLPVLEGGIRYVLKYVDKQMFGDDLKKNFTDRFIEPPFSSFSTGIGNELFFDQYNYIRATGNYKNLAGKERPIAPYYRDLFGAPEAQPKFNRLYEQYLKRNPTASLLSVDDYANQIMYARERQYAQMALADGHATYVPDKPNSDHYGAVRQFMFKQYEQSKIKDWQVFNESAIKALYELGSITV